MPTNYEELSDINKIIYDLFSARWSDDIAKAGIDRMRKQLHKNLTDQLNGYWSGHTAYHLIVDGGFMYDAKSGDTKRLTALGKMFMSSMEKQNANN